MPYKQLKLWFDKKLAESLAAKIQVITPDFRGDLFVKSLSKGLNKLELKDRVELIADELFFHFDKDYLRGLEQILKILGPENEEETGMFKKYYWIMPLAKYVEKYGLEHLRPSLNAIEEITKRNTGEYAIRPFLEQHTSKTIARMGKWSKSRNKHLRRLSSEGIRPRLPWAKKLDLFIENPSPILPILDQLKDDPSKYVQKSVANCINDILKDNPETGKKLIESWNTKENGKARTWIIKHALRNLLKKEDPWAIKMIL